LLSLFSRLIFELCHDSAGDLQVISPNSDTVQLFLNALILDLQLLDSLVLLDDFKLEDLNYVLVVLDGLRLVLNHNLCNHYQIKLLS